MPSEEAMRAARKWLIAPVGAGAREQLAELIDDEFVVMRQRLAELEAEAIDLRVKAIPCRQHSDEAWRKRVAALEAERDSLRQQLEVRDKP